ncbi:YdeI/OmpD-associated family protein [Kibdelosporangium philippinense]|uniref:YdeI/OmpD-associated family protein n=1 Tax=Kibdelosporangium philippinense TaxID=211113 RepID=A0ABS8Z9K0_9PSEU|nr:YdeI/OmpD-associated family protein [Kibdelosporangium philippinense]MCE7003789.1 YdeI/OmpD-associated family protein [Kibdelosporangium philippinense]
MSTFYASTTAEWRAWLAENSDSATEIWLILHHRSSDVPSPGYHEAIEQALCFGWIDSHHRKRDATSSQLRFSPRTARSSWSQLNHDRAARMIALGQMTPRGQALIDHAKANGIWDAPTVPEDLQALLVGDAATNFASFPLSSQRLILEWIRSAKKPETRQRRIVQTVSMAARNLRAR